MEEDVEEKGNIPCCRKVTFEVEDTSFTMDKALLVSNSEYFRLMFLGSFVEKHLEVVRIEMIRKEDFRLFVDFLERREIRWQEVTSENLLRILDSATMLRLNCFIDACEEPLMKKWDNFGSASEIYSMSITYGMEKLTSQMLRLLAQCMDIGFQISMNEMFYEAKIEQCVYFNEVSYEYLLHCLRNTRTHDGICLGPSSKDFFPGLRDSSESRALLEWVLRWIFHAVGHNDKSPEPKQVEALIQLCDVEFLANLDIEETLEQAVLASNIDADCAMLGSIKTIFKYLSARTKVTLDNLNLDIFFTSSKKNDVIPAFRVRKLFANNSWSVEELSIPDDSFYLKVFGSHESSVFFYRGCLKDCWRYHLDTKELVRVLSWQMEDYLKSAAISKNHFFCYCEQHWLYHEAEGRINLAPILCSFDLKVKSWSRILIPIRDTYWFCNCNMVYVDGYLYFVLMDKVQDLEVQLVRYAPERKELRMKRIHLDTEGLDSDFDNLLNLAAFQDRLLLFVKTKIVVINPTTFDDKTLGTKVIDFQMNDWKLLDVKVRDDVLLVITYPPSILKFDLRKIHISKLCLNEDKLIAVGFLDRTIANLQVPMTSQFKDSNCLFL